MQRELQHLISVQSELCVADELATLENGATQHPWKSIVAQHMEVVAKNAVALYKDSMSRLVSVKEPTSRRIRRGDPRRN